MGGIDRLRSLELGLEQLAGDFAKAVTPVTHRQQLKGIVRPRTTPAACDSLRGSGSRQGAFELVRNDQNLHRHAPDHRPESACQSQI